MQAIPDTVDFSVAKVLQDMEGKVESTGSRRNDISELTEVIYRTIASKWRSYTFMYYTVVLVMIFSDCHCCASAFLKRYGGPFNIR